MDISKIHFIVVDDMATMRKIISNQLKKLGAVDVKEATNGALAWKALEESEKAKVPIQFVISDWNMPEMSGLELLKKCRTSPFFKNIHFLMITAEGEKEQIEEITKSGADDFIIKPFAPPLFQEKMNNILTKRPIK